jgi:FAD binding domain
MGACISRAKTFSTWEDVTTTEVKIQFPRTDGDLRRILTTASTTGRKIRVMGATHSAAGVVTSGCDHGGSPNHLQQTVITLSCYKPSTPGWEQIMLDTSKGTVRVPAGRTLLDLYAVIRPEGYFLPTQTAGWFFTVGGVISSSVHGGMFGADMLNRYVVGVLVMQADGSVHHITEESELRYYRCGFGLLGVVLAVEMRVVQRERFTIDYNSHEFEWSEKNFSQYVAVVKNRASYGEFFMHFLNPDIASVVSVEFLIGEMGEPVKKRKAKAVYKAQKKLYRKISTEGDPVIGLMGRQAMQLSPKCVPSLISAFYRLLMIMPDAQQLPFWWAEMQKISFCRSNTHKAVKAMINATAFGVKLYTAGCQHGANDGFWVQLATGMHHTQPHAVEGVFLAPHTHSPMV